MRKAQGSLEYLIIIAAVLAIAAVVVMYLSGVFGGTGASWSRCRETASNCAAMQVAGPFDCGEMCAAGCLMTNGSDIKSWELEPAACVEEHNSACGLCMNGTLEGIEPA